MRPPARSAFADCACWRADTQARIDYLVPNRFEYGYGLTPEIVELAAQGEPDLIITVDNSIASVEGVARANDLGIAVLVTDHHLPGPVLPAAACIVNPNQPGCGFPSKNLAGVGVMFYVLLALRAELRARGAFAHAREPHLAALTDLVALGTVADVVPLDANNRILVAQGLKRIRAGEARPGIDALFAAAGREPRSARALQQRLRRRRGLELAQLPQFKKSDRFPERTYGRSGRKFGTTFGWTRRESSCGGAWGSRRRGVREAWPARVPA